MADTGFKYIATDSSKEAINNLNSVQGLTLGELQKTANVFYSFLKAIDSQEESWLKLKQRLDNEAPEFLIKVRIAFIYYYATVVSKAFIGTDDEIKNPKTFRANLLKLATFINSPATNASDVFDKMFSGNTKGIAANEIASHFIVDVFETHEKKALKDVIANFEANPDTMDPSDFFQEFSKVVQKHSDVSNKPDLIRKTVKHEVDSNKIEIKLYMGLLRDLINSSLNGSAFTKNILEKKVYKKYLEDMKDANAASEIVAVIDQITDSFPDLTDNESYKGAIQAFTTNDKILAILSRARHKEEDANDAETSSNAEAVEKDLLAMNMADYITKRITAQEFQRRDAEIRAGQSQVLDEDDSIMSSTGE